MWCTPPEVSPWRFRCRLPTHRVDPLRRCVLSEVAAEKARERSQRRTSVFRCYFSVFTNRHIFIGATTVVDGCTLGTGSASRLAVATPQYASQRAVARASASTMSSTTPSVNRSRKS